VRPDEIIITNGAKPALFEALQAFGGGAVPGMLADYRALTHDTAAFAKALLEHALVAVMPGEALGVAGFIRLGYIAGEVATLVAGIEKILAFGDAFKPRMQ